MLLSHKRGHIVFIMLCRWLIKCCAIQSKTANGIYMLVNVVIKQADVCVTFNDFTEVFLLNFRSGEFLWFLGVIFFFAWIMIVLKHFKLIFIFKLLPEIKSFICFSSYRYDISVLNFDKYDLFHLLMKPSCRILVEPAVKRSLFNEWNILLNNTNTNAFHLHHNSNAHWIFSKTIIIYDYFGCCVNSQIWFFIALNWMRYMCE